MRLEAGFFVFNEKNVRIIRNFISMRCSVSYFWIIGINVTAPRRTFQFSWQLYGLRVNRVLYFSNYLNRSLRRINCVYPSCFAFVIPRFRPFRKKNLKASKYRLPSKSNWWNNGTVDSRTLDWNYFQKFRIEECSNYSNSIERDIRIGLSENDDIASDSN